MKKIKINVVGFWDGFDKSNWFVVNLLKKHYDIEFSDKPDFLFYTCFTNEYEKFDNCIKIFFTGEPIVPNFNQCDYATGFAYLDFGDRYFRRYNTELPVTAQDRSCVTDDFAKRRFCNFIYSKQWTPIRENFCKQLMEYKHVDCPGKVLHNMDTDELEPRNGDWQNSKKEFLKKYKFTIAFENSLSDGYTTEKLFNPFESFSVPIYWGNPSIVKDANPKAFINCNDYNNDFDAVIERVKYLDTHDDEYLAMLREQPMLPSFDFARSKKFEEWLVNIIEHGKIFDKGIFPQWDIDPYKKEVLKLQKDNTNLVSDVKTLKDQLNKTQNNGVLEVVELKKSICKLNDDIVSSKNYVHEIDNAIINVKNEFNSLQKDIINTNRNLNYIYERVKNDHKKIRNKYFPVLLISQFLLLLLVLFGLFV